MLRGSRARRSVLALLGLVALTGCGVPSNAPSAYDEQVEANFLLGCTGDVPETDGSTTTLASDDQCGCAYDVFVAMVPYDDDARDQEQFAGYPADAPTFRDVDGNVDGDPEEFNKLPQDVRDALAACEDGGAPTTSDTAGEASEGTTSDTVGDTTVADEGTTADTGA